MSHPRRTSDDDLSDAFTQAAQYAVVALVGDIEQVEQWHVDLSFELMTAEYKRRRVDWERAYARQHAHERV